MNFFTVGASGAFLRTLAVIGAMGASTAPTPTLPPTDAVPTDAVTLTRTLVDADGHVIVRRGDPDRLGRLADHCNLGTGPDDCRLKNDEHGYVVMAGKDIPSDHLTVPLAPISGVEAPQLWQPGAENYFADAWRDGRGKAAEALGTTAEQLPRNAIALAVNSQGGRSQDRLHIHADRLDPELGRQLKDQLGHGQVVSDHWTDLAPVHGHQYRALWIEGAELQQNPFQLVHDQLVAERGETYANTHMGQHTLAVVGETDAQGRPGFILIDGGGSAEEWLLGHAHTPR